MNSPEEFIDLVMKESPLMNLLGKDEKEIMKDDLLNQLEESMNAKILDSLTPAQQQEFEKLLDSETGDVQGFLTKAIPNYDQVMGAVMVEFKNRYE